MKPKESYLHELYLLACECKNRWEEAEAVDWNDAEMIVKYIQHLSPDVLTKYPMLQGIKTSAATYENWDSGEVGLWPEIVIESLAGEKYT